MYFQSLPKIFYDDRYVTNILASVRKRKSSFTNNYMLFNEYLVLDGDTPEIVSHKVYGTTEYWWIVCIVNNIFSLSQWPKSQKVLDKYIERKYGDQKHNTAYYVQDGVPVNKRFRTEFSAAGSTITYHEDQDDLGAATYKMIVGRGEKITWNEFENIINDERRSIKILSKEYVNDFVLEYKKLMSQNG